MQNLDDLNEKAATIMLRRRKDMVEDELPRRTDKNYFVPMTKEQSLRYCEFEDKVARLCARAKKRPLTKDEMKLLQRHLACMRMLCDTCFILDDEIRVSPKIDEAMAVFEDIFSSDPSRKVVVFSEWVKMLELLEERLEKEGVGFAVHTGSVRQDRRREELKRFKTDPDCRVLLSSEAGGVGLNLQNASVVMNLDLPWNPAKLEQRIARAWRKKQSREVLVINLVSEGTIEQRMLGTLKFKQGLADMVLDARGDASDFESENSKNAFLARVSSLMESQQPAVARADGTAGTSLAESGRGSGIAENASEKETSQKMRIDEVLTEEMLMRLAELEKLGLVTLGEEAKKRLSLLSQGGETQSVKRQDRNLAMEKRLTVVRSAMEKARRLVQMGDLLHGGGFEEESMKPYCEAASLAGAAILFLDGGKRSGAESVNDVPDEVSSLTNDDYSHIQKEGMLSKEVIATLDYALNKGFIPNAEHRMRILMEECANLANGFGLRGIR
jgi:superfamily II DNA/RNA helicase